MKKQIDELKELTEGYLVSKRELEAIERQYNALYAALYFNEAIAGLKNEEMRKQEMTRILENEHKELLDSLYNARGRAREFYFRREALMVILKLDKEPIV